MAAGNTKLGLGTKMVLAATIAQVTSSTVKKLSMIFMGPMFFPANNWVTGERSTFTDFLLLIYRETASTRFVGIIVQDSDPPLSLGEGFCLNR
ncbi:hypothetical protein L4X63_09690 [Geomonas sp. Red32]|uniref:hypothetical protein n=1 Tax=Geomonas sp. Red32 TaxID=2912856 RepID=UPI00202CC30B|nr:hypothetical protein [Geomonas sp. Red32]MCM0081861.1 hypothetical protein [Geomonas sp. Red32]